MFQNKSVAEWNAEQERLRSEIAATKTEAVNRELTREKRKLKIQDFQDKLLDLEIVGAETSVKLKEIGVQSDKVLLKTAESRLKYLMGKHSLTERGFQLDLQVQEAELASSEEKLRQLRSVANTLSYNVANTAAQKAFGGSANG